MQAEPYDPVGYIRAAGFYSLRGQQKRVMLVVEKGIENISIANNKDDDVLKK